MTITSSSRFVEATQTGASASRTHEVRTASATDGFDVHVSVAARPLDGEARASSLEVAYEALRANLEAQGIPASAVIAEWVCVGSPRERERAGTVVDELRQSSRFWADFTPATFILDQRAAGGDVHAHEVQLRVLASGRALDEYAFGPGRLESTPARRTERPSWRIVRGPDRRELWAAGIRGSSSGEEISFEQEARTLFENAAKLLENHQMSLGDIVRTWLYVVDIDRDYAALNRVRRRFFAANDLGEPPASTGIGGGPRWPGCRVMMGFVAQPRGVESSRRPLHCSSLNEAPSYGADFSRGFAVESADRKLVHISGTASVDERGRSCHRDDLQSQVDRMLQNVDGLLAAEGLSRADILSAASYLRRARDRENYERRLFERDFPAVPHTIVEAHVCRPDLLCEVEVIAATPTRKPLV